MGKQLKRAPAKTGKKNNLLFRCRKNPGSIWECFLLKGDVFFCLSFWEGRQLSNKSISTKEICMNSYLLIITPNKQGFVVHCSSIFRLLSISRPSSDNKPPKPCASLLRIAVASFSRFIQKYICQKLFPGPFPFG